jgi:hypothetical protein
MAHAVWPALVLACGGALAAVAQGQSAEPIPQDTLITLERVECSAACPIYSITVDARGNIVYDGKEFVRVEGEQTDRIPQTAVRELLEMAGRIGFFDFRDSYVFIQLPDGTARYQTDNRRSFITVRANGRSKRIEDYYGTPEPLKQFEDRIDVLTRTRRWTFLDEAMLRRLRQDGWTPSPAELAVLLDRAVRWDDVAIIEGLLAFGADPNLPAEHMGWPLMAVQSAAAMRAMLAAGADPFIASDEGVTMLHVAAHFDLGVTAALLRAGLPLESSNNYGWTPLMTAAHAGNAGVVERLLGAGANPASTNSEGLSVLQVARNIREADHAPHHPAERFRRDRDRVVTLLEAALARRAR